MIETRIICDCSSNELLKIFSDDDTNEFLEIWTDHNCHINTNDSCTVEKAAL
jgi:hypothetical protein